MLSLHGWKALGGEDCQMKCSKIFCTLVLAVILSLLLVVIPATPALAAPEITLTPTSGSVGPRVTVTGINFESVASLSISMFLTMSYLG